MKPIEYLMAQREIRTEDLRAAVPSNIFFTALPDNAPFKILREAGRVLAVGCGYRITLGFEVEAPVLH